jgi:hypothetical protein
MMKEDKIREGLFASIVLLHVLHPFTRAYSVLMNFMIGEKISVQCRIPTTLVN